MFRRLPALSVKLKKTTCLASMGALLEDQDKQDSGRDSKEQDMAFMSFLDLLSRLETECELQETSINAEWVEGDLS
jgi:hypothetical protein